MSELNFAVQSQTKLAAQGVGVKRDVRSVAPPLYLSATYAWDDPEDKPGYDYSRSGNPTRTELERALCDLEGAAGGVVTATGMAAVNLPLCLIKPGDRVIAPHDCYGGTYRLLSHRAAKGDFEVEFVDQTDPAALEEAFARDVDRSWLKRLAIHYCALRTCAIWLRGQRRQMHWSWRITHFYRQPCKTHWHSGAISLCIQRRNTSMGIVMLLAVLYLPQRKSLQMSSTGGRTVPVLLVVRLIAISPFVGREHYLPELSANN